MIINSKVFSIIMLQMKNSDKMYFPTALDDIIKKLDQFSPTYYASSRNYLDGSVSYLSPYISRGVISTKFVLHYLLEKGHDIKRIEKFTQELAWRDYWQQIWLHKAIDKDLKHQQPNVDHHKVPNCIISAKTNINAIDKGINNLMETGYMHNHIRMYVAMLTCNIGRSHWLQPAKWMYYHLLDHDWASNALSWQWVVGANSNKKYIANQANINKYSHDDQKETYLDYSYEYLEKCKVPITLKDTIHLELTTLLPSTQPLNINLSYPSFIYNSYNLDPLWKENEEGNRILLLEPSHFEKYPVSDKVIAFIMALSQNINNIQVFVGEFAELQKQLEGSRIYYKEHPTTTHYQGIKDERDWISDVKGYYPSFFKFWKLVKKELIKSFSYDTI